MPNYYDRRPKPALPEAMRNLLDLHGLAARPANGQQYYKGARTRTSWEIFKPQPQIPGAHGRRPRSMTLQRMLPSATLDEWVEVVGKISSGVVFITEANFQTYDGCPVKGDLGYTRAVETIKRWIIDAAKLP